MGLISLKCPQCGANLEVEDGKDYYFCHYCGCKVINEKIIVEHTGTVDLNGIANRNSLLERADMFLKNREFEKATNYFERVLDADPKCAKAYMGEVLCENCLTNISELERTDIDLSNDKTYKYALEFADKDQKEKYSNVQKSKIHNFIIDSKNKKKELENSLHQYYQSKREVNAVSKDIEGIFRSKLSIICLVLMVFSALIFISISIQEKKLFIPFLVLFLVLVIVYIVGVVVPASKLKNEKNKTDKKRAELLSEWNKETGEYNQWVNDNIPDELRTYIDKYKYKDKLH